MIRAKNYNLTAIILIAVSITIAAFAAVQFAGKSMHQQSSANQKLAQIGKDKKPKLKPGKHDASIQASALLAPSEEQEADLPVVHKSGALTEDETWGSGYVYAVEGSGVTIPDGKKLTIAPGAIVKYEWAGSIIVNHGGELNAEGSNTNPIVFTSYKDDEYGGDSNEDGVSVGSYGDTGSMAIQNYGGTVALSFSIVKNLNYAYWAMCAQGGSNQINDNNLYNGLYISDCDINSVTVSRNTFNMDGQGHYAIDVQDSDVSGIQLSSEDQNEFIGSQEGNVISLTNSRVDNGQSWIVSSGNNAVLMVEGLNIAGDVTLRGSTIKYPWAGGITVTSQGALLVSNDGTNNAMFTSYRDDSVGGDSNADGNSTGAPGESGSVAITSNGGHVEIDHATFRNSNYAVWAFCNNSMAGGLDLHDNLFNNGIYIDGCDQSAPKLSRNTFNVPSSLSIPPLDMRGVNPKSLTLVGSNKNIFLGDDVSRAIWTQNLKLPEANNWILSSEGGASIVMNQIDAYGSLVINPGALVKLNGEGIHVFEGGSLTVNGSAESPVIFTSIKDDSLAGDNNADGFSQPTMGDFNHAVVSEQGASVNINFSKIYYGGFPLEFKSDASLNNVSIIKSARAIYILGSQIKALNTAINETQVGIETSGQAYVVFRGTIINASDKAIRACNWGSSSCSVDAAYTDWGSASGPNTSSQTLVCGQVTIAPWVYNGNTVNGGLFGSGNCDSSPTPDQQLGTSATHFSDRMSLKGIDCSNGFQDACDAMQTAQTCLGAATSLAASTSSFPLPNGNAYDQPAQWGGMLADNASDFIQSVEGPVPILEAASFATKLLGAATTILNVANAYNTCAP